MNHRSSHNSKIIVYDNELRVSTEDIRNLKDILDKLKVHYIIDDVSFNATDKIVDLMEYFRQIKVYRKEEKGDVNLKNRLGFRSQLASRILCIPSLVEFIYADMDILDHQEALFLDALIKKASNISIFNDLP